MGLFDFNKRLGGLFDQPPVYSTPGIGDGIPGNKPMGGPSITPALPDFGLGMQAPELPPVDQKQGKGGVFGSGYSGEDIMSMLLRAAAIAQGDLGAGAQFGSNIGAKARADAERAAEEAQWRNRKTWEWENEPRSAPDPYRWRNNEGDLMEVGPDGQPRVVFDDPTRKPEYRVGPDGRFYPIDVATPPAAPVGKLTPITGDGAGNGPGGFPR